MSEISEKADNFMLIDTDVIIWYMRGNKKAYSAIESQKGFSVSVVTYMELIQGMRDKRELRLLKKFLKQWDSEILSISEIISTKAASYVEQFYLSHSMQIADALIAATAVIHKLPILTGNDKHYKVIRELDTKAFRP